MNIDEVYKVACEQDLRLQDRRVVYKFAAALLTSYATEILETINHSDVDNHDFENGKEAVAMVLMGDASRLKSC